MALHPTNPIQLKVFMSRWMESKWKSVRSNHLWTVVAFPPLIDRKCNNWIAMKWISASSLFARSIPHRVVVFGAGGVGKSSLVLRFIKGTFRENYIPTIEDTYRQVSDLYQNDGWEDEEKWYDKRALINLHVIIYNISSLHLVSAIPQHLAYQLLMT